MKAGVEAEMQERMFNGVVPNRALAAIHGQGPGAVLGGQLSGVASNSLVMNAEDGLCLANQQTSRPSAWTQGVVAQVGEASTAGKQTCDSVAPTDASFRLQVERLLSEQTSLLVNWYQFDESNPVFEGKTPKETLASLEKEMQQVCPHL